MRQDEVTAVLNKPIARELLRSPTLARVAYTGTDGFPRAIPTGFWWDGARLIVCTAPRAPKVPALRARPNIALTIDTEGDPKGTPPRVLLIRGVVSLETVDGVPEEFLKVNRKSGTPDDWRAFEEQARAMYDRMVRITIEPRWAKLLDFETTLPQAVDEIVRHKQPGLLPGDD